MKRRLVVALVFCFFIVWGGWQTVYAVVRDGVDCNCTKTGDYKDPTAGSAPKTGDFPAFVEQADGTFDSPGGEYTLEISDDGTTTYLQVRPAAGGSAIYSTSLFTNSIALNSDEFQTPGGHNIMAGFSPDSDRFVYHYLDTGGLYHVRLIDLADGGRIVKEYDLGVTSATLAFSPKGAQLLFTWSTVSDLFFRVTNAVTGDDVFTESTAPDFDQAATPWGFSPDGKLLVYHYVSDIGGNPRHYVRLYTLSTPAAVQTAAFDMAISFSDPRAGASLRFAPKSGFLLYAADGPSGNQTILQVRDTADGSVVWQETFSYTPNPGDKGDKFKGATWGFSNDSKNLNLIYAVDTSLTQFALNLVDLATGQKVLNQNAVDVVSGFWQFSPCGDKLALVAQGNSGQLNITLYDTNDGNTAFTQSVASTVEVAFASTATDHWVIVDNGTPQVMVSNTADGSCDTTAPQWPSGAKISADSKTERSVALSWPSATDAVRYVLFRDGVEETDTTGTSYMVSGLSPDTAYLFKVEAEDAAGNRSTNGPSLTATTLPDNTPPSWPAGAAATVTEFGDYWIAISWDAALDASSYVILIEGNQVATTGSDTRQYYTEGLDEGTAYTFKIEAEDAAGNRTNDGPSVTGTTKDLTRPEWQAGAVLEVSAFSPDGTSLTLSWTAATDTVGVDHYELRMEDPSGGGYLVNGPIPADTTSFMVNDLELGESYYFFVRAYDAAGNYANGPSLWANTDGQPPTWDGAALRVDAADATSLTVGWDPAIDNVGVDSYLIFFDGVLISGNLPATQHTLTVTCLLPETAYTIRVEARDLAQNVSSLGPQSVAATAPGTVSPDDGVTTRESLGPEGIEADGYSEFPSISDDGRFVVFQSSATTLVAGDTNGRSDVFVRDRVTGTTERVSVASDGTEGNQNSSGGPKISANGRYILFHSFANNLVSGYSNHAFLHDRIAATTQAVAVSRLGGVPNSSTSPEDLSTDGRKVLFSSSATNLIVGDANGRSDLFLRNLGTGETVLVSVSQGGVQGNDNTFVGDMSRDGRYVVMKSNSTNLVDGATNAAGGIYFKDMQTGDVELIAADVNNAPGVPYKDFLQPVVSDDGRYVAYTLNSLDPGWMVLLHDRETGETRRIDETPFGAAGGSSSPVITADGRYVVFDSHDGALADDTNNNSDVFLYDRISDSLSRVSVCTGGGQVSGSSSAPAVTADGSAVAFFSDAPNLVPLPADSNNVADVFVRMLSHDTTSKGDLNADGTVDLSDVIIALQIQSFALLESTTDMSSEVNGDGKIGLEEVVYILQKISGLRQ